MYGSPYGSYSGMSAPMDISPGHNYSHTQDASCAFPSWPRRSSLSAADGRCERATSYLSDEDLLDGESEYQSDANSVSSANSSSTSTPQQEYCYHQPYQPETAFTGETVDALERQRERAAYQREVMRFLALEKERRRTAAAAAAAAAATSGAVGGKRSKSRSGSSSSKKGSPKSKLAGMPAIAEAE